MLFSQSLTYILRNRTKMLMVFAVVFILGNAISAAIVMKIANNNIKQQMEMAFMPTVSIVPVYDDTKGLADVETIDTKNFDELGSLQYVTEYEYNVFTSFETPDLVTSDEPETAATANGNPYLEGKGVMSNDFADLKNNKITIVEGRNFTQAEIDNGDAKVIISQKTFELNNLNIGDTFEIANNFYEFSPSSVPDFTTLIPYASLSENVEIIGVFAPTDDSSVETSETTGVTVVGVGSDWNNLLYIPNDLSITFDRFDGQANSDFNPIFYNNKFVLSDRTFINEFSKRVSEILPEHYIVKQQADNFNDLLAPITLLETVSTFTLIITIIVAIIILALVIYINVFQRKYEIGIYIALGRSKFRIACQLIMEMLIVGSVAVGTSMITGKLLSENVSDYLIRTQMLVQEESDDRKDILDFLLRRASYEYEILENYDINFSLAYFFSYFSIGVLVIVTATGIPLVIFLQVSPKKLLLS